MKKQLRPNRSDQKAHDHGNLPWYRAPIVWLGIAISVLIVFGYARLVVISHQSAAQQPDAAVEAAPSKHLKSLLGMPLSRDPVRSEAGKPADGGPDDAP